jgi:hypothetical protein
MLCVCVDATSGQELTLKLKLKLAYLDDPRMSTESVFWRAITTSNSIQTRIHDGGHCLGLPSGPLLAQFLRGSQSLQVLDIPE